MSQRTGTQRHSLDFFISYSPADERWATWIAWELEHAGYTTVLQAWDFVPGTNFVDFMDRGVREAAVVVAVLSRNYLTSRYGRLEWQAALRADPGDLKRLVTVRIEDCPLEGLLSMITYLDLVGVTDAQVARTQLLSRMRQALDGRAKPSTSPGFPAAAPAVESAAAAPPVATAPPPTTAPPLPDALAGPHQDGSGQAGRPGSRRAPGTAPVFPPAAQPAHPARTTVTVLHLSGPRLGRGLVEPGQPASAQELQTRIYSDLTRLTADGAPNPDLLVVTGDLTETGSVREFAEATELLTGLRVLLGLEPGRLVVVPGGHDITRPACRAYFADCEADDIPPKPPYWPKWRHYSRLFEELYQGLDELTFDSQQPWTLFTIPELRVVVAGLNSTINDSHRDDDHYGWIGEAQASWFAHRLRAFEEAGWLRIGVSRHAPAGTADVPVSFDPGSGLIDNGLLRDTTTFDGLLGKRLNLLLHGPVQLTGGETPAGGPPPGAPGAEGGPVLVPPIPPGRCQLLQITSDGVSRTPLRSAGEAAAAAADGLDQGERTSRRWHAVSATFGPAVSGTDGADGAGSEDTGIGAGTPARATEPPRAPHPDRQLLDRIAEVCQARHDNVKIRMVEGELSHLLVSYREDGFVRQLRVAGHVGTPTSADIDRFLSQVHAADPDTPSELVYQGAPISQSLRLEAARRDVRVRSFIEFQGMLDLREFVASQTARLTDDLLYPPSLYVPQRFRELTGADRTIRRDLVGELLSQVARDEGRFVLVMGDFGRGKTFALREVARRIPTELPHLIPILLELRSLEKAHSVEAMVAAHLASHGEELIDLRAFDYMLRQGRIVLLFDGFDELATRVTYDRAADHLDMVLQAATDKAKIIISSRSQHFRTDEQVLTALGERVGVLAQRRLLTIEDFSSDQIRTYLGNRYGGDDQAAEHRLRLLHGTQNLLGLSQNPRMLSFIADLDEARLRSVAESGNVISAAFLYQEVLGSWLAYEERRTGEIHGAVGGLTIDELWQAVIALAVRLWEANEQYLEPSDLAEVAGTLSTLSERQLSPQQAVHAVGAGSLLMRTEDGRLGLIHNSVTEWLIAKAIADRFAAGDQQPALLSRRPLSQLSIEFLGDLADTRACQAWLRGVLADPGADEVARLNAIKLSTRLRTMTKTDLRGAVLRGEDLSHRELLDADLTGADLTDARLVGTNLSRAVLRDAVLVRARLDEAVLAGADLTGADLSRARLAHADLRDAVLAGSRWRGAALIDVIAREEFFNAAELRGAVIAPGQPVEVELAPATLGVSFGFEMGRLPTPVDYSSDGQTLAIGNDEGDLLLCDPASGLPLRTLHGHSGRVYAVAYAPGGAVLATGASDCTLTFWDPATGRRLRTLEGFAYWVWPMSFSPDGRLIAAADSSGTVRVFDVATGTVCHELPGHSSHVWTARFRPDGRQLATGDSSGTVRVFDVATGALVTEYGGHDGSVYRLAFSPDSSRLATSDHGGTVRLFDLIGEAAPALLRGHEAAVYALDFHPSGQTLVSGDTRGGVWCWDVTSGQGTSLPVRGSGAIYWVRFSPSGNLLVLGGNDGVIRLWDVPTGAGGAPAPPAEWQHRHDLLGHRGSVWPVVFSPDGKQLASTSNDGTTRIWDPMTGQCRHLLRGHGRRITSVHFNAAGDLLATCGNDGVVRLWNPRTGTMERTLTGVADRLVSAFFDPASHLLATPSNDGDVHLWDSRTGGYERELNVHTDNVWAATFSPDGDIVATANDDDTVRLWYRTTGRHVHTLAEHRGRVRSIAFDPDGEMLATGCDDRMVRIWDATNGTCVHTLRQHTDRVYAVRYTPDGNQLLSASHDGTACIWDCRSGELLHVLRAGGGRLWSADIDPAGVLIATAGDDQVVDLWDARTGAHRYTLHGHTRRIWSVTFSPDGTQLASAGDDGTARIWDLGQEWNVDAPPVPRLQVALLALPDGWAALAPGGGYKLSGNVTGQFWHVIGTCRFEPGDIDVYLPAVRQLPTGEVF